MRAIITTAGIAIIVALAPSDQGADVDQRCANLAYFAAHEIECRDAIHPRDWGSIPTLPEPE